MPPDPDPDLDPIRAHRAKVARVASRARAGGYALFGLAIAVVVVGVLTRFTEAMATAAGAALIIGSMLLAPALVLGYGVKAAERDEKRRGL